MNHHRNQNGGSITNEYTAGSIELIPSALMAFASNLYLPGLRLLNCTSDELIMRQMVSKPINL